MPYRVELQCESKDNDEDWVNLATFNLKKHPAPEVPEGTFMINQVVKALGDREYRLYASYFEPKYRCSISLSDNNGVIGGLSATQRRTELIDSVLICRDSAGNVLRVFMRNI